MADYLKPKGNMMTLPRPSRRVVAEDVLAGRVDIDAYPFRYLYLTVPTPIPPSTVRSGFDARVDVVLSTVELMETRGWELVNLDELGQIAFMRRVAHQPGR